MTTANEIMLKVRALIDEYTDDGVVVSAEEVADINAKGILFIDMAQKELFRTGNLYKKKEFTQKNPDNLLGKYTGFDILEFSGDDIIKGGYSARSYCFEADDEGICYIEEFESGSWQTLATVNIASSTFMVAYKGLLTPTTNGNLIRFRWTGTTYYKIQNYALFSQPFKADKIPDYRPWIKYTMPSDYRMIDYVVNEYPEREYSKDANYKWEGFNELWLNYYFVGTIRANYKYIPTTITALTDILEVDDITINAIIYYVAAKVAAYEYPDLVNFYEGKYNELKLESSIKMPSSEQQIVDVYGGFYGNS